MKATCLSWLTWVPRPIPESEILSVAGPNQLLGLSGQGKHRLDKGQRKEKFSACKIRLRGLGAGLLPPLAHTASPSTSTFLISSFWHFLIIVCLLVYLHLTGTFSFHRTSPPFPIAAPPPGWQSIDVHGTVTSILSFASLTFR